MFFELEKRSDTGSRTASGGRLIVILGGARSGKSTFAEKLARRRGGSVAFIATATAEDAEMQERIAQHQASRPSSWRTIEEPLHLSQALQRASLVADTILLDCLTLWTSNWLLAQPDLEQSESPLAAHQFQAPLWQEIDELLQVLRQLDQAQTLIVVSNEVGLGIVPAYPLGRLYRDLLGAVNQRLASVAEQVYLLVAGIPIDVRRWQADLPF